MSSGLENSTVIQSILFKKYLNYNSTNVNKKFTEELIAFKRNYVKDLVLQRIPRHAPAANGKNVTYNNPKQNPLNIVSLEPKNFTAIDKDCPIGFTNYVVGSPYGSNAKVFYKSQYYESNTAIGNLDLPGVSPKWDNITAYALSIPLRKRYRTTVEPLPISDPSNKSFQSVVPVYNSVSPLMPNARLDIIQITINEFDTLREILIDDIIFINAPINLYFKVLKVEYQTTYVNVYLTKLNANDKFYNPANNNPGMLPSIITGTELFQLYSHLDSHLNNGIDFNFDYTYTPTIYDSANNLLPFGLGDYLFDMDIGIISYYETSPDVGYVSLYQYVGNSMLNYNTIPLSNMFVFSPVPQLLGSMKLNSNSDHLMEFSAIFEMGMTFQFIVSCFDSDEILYNITLTADDNKKINHEFIIYSDQLKKGNVIEFKGIKVNNLIIESMVVNYCLTV